MNMKYNSYAEHIGNPRGLIAVWLDKQEALDLAAYYGPRDQAYDELVQAVARAYPEVSE